MVVITDPVMAERATALIRQQGRLVARPDGRSVRVYEKA